MTTNLKNLLAILFLATIVFSCGTDDTSDDNGGSGSGGQPKYALSYWTSDYSQYLWQFDNVDQLMNGTINMNGVGIEQEGNCIPVGNTFFACSTESDGAVSYYLNTNGKVTAGDRVFIESNYAYTVTDDAKVLILGASWAGASTDNELMLYDPATVSIIHRKFDNFAAQGDLFYWPTAVSVSGNRAFVSVYLRDAAWNLTSDKAKIRVYEYPSLNYINTIEDTRTTAIGLYYSNTGMIRTDSGDIYSFSSNAVVAGYTPTAAPSGILRIKNGQSVIDASYFLNFENSVVNGKVVAAYPAGGEKAFVIYMPVSADATEPNYSFLNHASFKFKSALVDLATKTVTPVTGLPDHAGDNYYGIGSFYVENGKGYKSFVTNNESRIYQVDLTTGLAKPGALITGGLDIPAITKLTPR